MTKKPVKRTYKRVHQPVVPVLRIFNVEQAYKFYIEWLGFKTDWLIDETADSPAYFPIKMNRILLHLSEHYNDGSPGLKVFLHISNLNEYYKKLQPGKNNYYDLSLRVSSWGSPIMEITDPFNNRLVFCEYYPQNKNL